MIVLKIMMDAQENQQKLTTAAKHTRIGPTYVPRVAKNFDDLSKRYRRIRIYGLIFRTS